MRLDARLLISSRRLLGVLTAVVVTAMIAPTATAQSLWMQRDGEQTLMLEVLQPSLEGFDAKPFSAALFLSGRGTVSPRISVVGELPFARHRSTYLIFGPAEYSSSTIGNPYAGLEVKLGSGPAFLEIGVRPPLAPDDEYPAVLTGRSADIGRWEAFDVNAFAVLAAFDIREVTPSKVAFRLRVGPSVAISTENEDDLFYANYAFQIGYQGSKARIGVGMTGRSQLNELSYVSYDPYLPGAASNLGQRSASQFELHADFLSGRVRPGLDLHVPLDGMGNYVPLVLGASISWTR